VALNLLGTVGRRNSTQGNRVPALVVCVEFLAGALAHVESGEHAVHIDWAT